MSAASRAARNGARQLKFIANPRQAQPGPPVIQPQAALVPGQYVPAGVLADEPRGAQIWGNRLRNGVAPPERLNPRGSGDILDLVQAMPQLRLF